MNIQFALATCGDAELKTTTLIFSLPLDPRQQIDGLKDLIKLKMSPELDNIPSSNLILVNVGSIASKEEGIAASLCTAASKEILECVRSKDDPESIAADGKHPAGFSTTLSLASHGSLRLQVLSPSFRLLDYGIKTGSLPNHVSIIVLVLNSRKHRPDVTVSAFAATAQTFRNINSESSTRDSQPSEFLMNHFMSVASSSPVPQRRMPPTRKDLRPYQERILAQAIRQSGIAVLPTGSGKTLIASRLMVALHEREKNARFLFLVPTCLLVKQQSEAIEDDTGLRVARFMGGVTMPRLSSYDVIVATPGAILAQIMTDEDDVDRANSFSLLKFRLIIFDEVHHVVKRHPYRHIAHKIQPAVSAKKIHVLGLTASLTYATRAQEIMVAVSMLLVDLGLEGDCIYSATNEELLRDGYVAQMPGASNTVVAADITFADRLYKVLEMRLEPHRLVDSFLDQARFRMPSVHALSLAVMDLLEDVENAISAIDPTFISPVKLAFPIKDWGKLVHDRLAQYRLNSLSEQSELFVYVRALEHIYETVRLIVVSCQRDLELAMVYLLEMYGSVLKDIPEATGLRAAWMMCKNEFCRLAHLKDVVLQQTSRLGASLRCIVFVQQRLTAHILHYHFAHDADLADLKTAVLHATNSRATTALTVAPTQAKSAIDRFGRGQVQILFATQVAEEGMDIPEANSVIRFDSVQTHVSLVQSRGRARQVDSSFTVLAQSATKSLSHLEGAERAQKDVVSEILSKGGLVVSEVEQERMRTLKVPSMHAKLLKARNFFISGDAALLTPLAAVNTFAQKVGAEVRDVVEGNASRFKATLYFRADGLINGGRYVTTGIGLSKKAALHAAASDMLIKLSAL